MRVFELRAAANSFQNLVMSDPEEWDELVDLLGQPSVRELWRPFEVETLRGGTNRDLPVGDYPSLSPRLPVFSDHAIDVLGADLRSCGEALPLRCSEGSYVAFHVTDVRDALDEASSELRYFPGGSKVLRVVKYVFKAEALEDAYVFQIPQLRATVLATDRLARAVSQAGLIGLNLRPLWSSGDDQEVFDEKL
jgi:hypothetical protein